MKPKKRMVTVNVAIHINKDDPSQCGYGSCRFLDELEHECRLFVAKLRSKDVGFFRRCKACLAVEPVE